MICMYHVDDGCLYQTLVSLIECATTVFINACFNGLCFLLGAGLDYLHSLYITSIETNLKEVTSNQ